jgi:mono/diheme cytochrome c family protein
MLRFSQRRFVVGSTSVLLTALCQLPVYGQTTASPAQANPAAAQKLVTQYCAGCHNDRLKSGDFSWSKLDLAHPDQNAAEAEKVIRKVRVGLMPPPGMPRPNESALKGLASFLESSIDQAASLHPNPGRTALHRLNRTEYANSVRDLLDVDIDVSPLLPADDMSHGFDNMADVLGISPALMEGYIRAAGKISREAVGDASALAHTTTYSIPRVTSQARHIEGTPLGTRGGISVVHDFPADGEYVFKMGFYYTPTGPLFGQNQGKGQQIEVAVNGERVGVFDINPAMQLAKDGIKSLPIKVRAGPQRISASFPQKFDGPIDDEFAMVEQTLVDISAGVVPGITTLPHLHELSITGPTNTAGVSDTPSRRKVFACRPVSNDDEIACAKKILGALARQAYRRPVTPNDLEGLLSFYQSGRNHDGNKPGTFETGIRTGIQAVLSNPEFVFRFEREPAGVVPGKNYRINDLELAARLSFFLWSSAPDDQLITLASQGKLKDPITLEKQVRRMLADSRSSALTANFANQWLHLQNLKGINPDLFLFPNFDKTLANSMRRETELLFENVMREDRGVLDLVTAPYTFVDERLAKHYGIPNILGNRFRKVTLDDSNRFGLLGHGSILTLTSTATRTSPVNRGKYVMEVLLGTPPPPPPAVVPALSENADLRTAHVTKLLSVRERMEEHRANPNCAGCHKLMDPIGFSLENFDAVGVWRTNDSGFKIDASGKMFDGAKLDGPMSLRQAVLNHSDAFIGTFTENLLAYGMGRVLEYYDEPTVRAIDKEAAKNGNRFSAFVMAIVKSAPFQMRRAEDAEPVATDVVGNR